MSRETEPGHTKFQRVVVKQQREDEAVLEHVARHSAGVDEYWIADLDARVFECRAPERERPDIRRDELVWRPRGASTPFLLDVRAFFDGNKGLKRLI